MPYITQTAIGIRDQLSVFGSDYETRDGTAIRDYIHVMDLADAHLAAIKRLIACKVKGCEHYNVGTGQGSTVLEVISSFEKTTGQSLNYVMAPRRKGDVASIYADVTLAKNNLQWHAKYNLDDMTKSAWVWEQNVRK